MTARKIAAMHERFGTCGTLRCKDCDHLLTYEYRGRRYNKCKLYGISNSEATDWRQHWQACGMYNMDVGPNIGMTVLEMILHAPRGPEPPLDGQMRIEDFERATP